MSYDCFMKLDSNSTNAVGRKIRKLRLERDWTQADLGKRARIDGKNVSNYETGNLRASEKTLQKFAQAFGVAIDEFSVETPSEPVLAIEDPDLLSLFREITRLPESAKAHTKWVLTTIVKQNRIQQVVAS